MLKVEQLVKQYGDKKVVNRISFEVKKGEILALLGKSGCGKTTTLKMINRLITPSGGKILINDVDAMQQNVDDLRRKIGYVIQENGLFPHYTVAQNIAIVPKLLHYSPAQIEQLIPEMLTQLELPVDFQHKFPHELSGGQQQRVAIARAIATKPPLLLMDEPFSALDPITRTGVRERFVALSKEVGITVVVVTHDVAEAIEMADVICLMNDGEIEQMGSADELIFQPKNEFVRSFFDGNRLETELKVLKVQQVLPFLHPVKQADQETIPISTEQSLYEVLEQNTHRTRPLKLMNQQVTLGTIQAEMLFQAFQQYKQQHHV